MITLDDATMAAIGRELVKVAKRGSPLHPQLRRDIRNALLIAEHSPTFRRVVESCQGQNNPQVSRQDPVPVGATRQDSSHSATNQDGPKTGVRVST